MELLKICVWAIFFPSELIFIFGKMKIAMSCGNMSRYLWSSMVGKYDESKKLLKTNMHDVGRIHVIS